LRDKHSGYLIQQPFRAATATTTTARSTTLATTATFGAVRQTMQPTHGTAT